ncbi:peptidylprolyl isomerase, partial [Pseudidiomarina aestuarii]
AMQDLIEELRSDAEVVNNTETPATDDSAETPKN